MIYYSACLLKEVTSETNCTRNLKMKRIETMADFRYGVNTDVNIGVSVTRGGNTLFEMMCIC